MDRSGSEWFAADVAFIGTVAAEDSTGNVQIEGHDEDEVLQAPLTQKYEPWGFTSRMPDNTEVLILPKEDAEVAILGVNVDRGTLDAGQTKIYDNGDNTILLKAAGGGIKAETAVADQIDLISKVMLGSATAAEALLKGTTVHGDLTVWYAALSAFLGTWSSAIGTQGPPGSGILGTLSASDPTEKQLIDYFNAFVTPLGTLITAIGTLQGLMANWKSTKHALDT